MRGGVPGQHGWRLRPLCAALLLAGAQQQALALPTGGQVVSGTVSVQTVSPNQMNINQTSGSGIVNWQGFSIGSGQLVQVIQPGASATLLNRVTGVDPSLILGHLSANGQVFLINPRGIVFGAGSQIDAGSFVASTLGISDQDFKAGKYSLLAGPGAPGALQADGSMSAPNGTVVLVAPQLGVSGDISARRVGLAAAGSAVVDVEGDGLVLFNVANTQNLDARLSMLGRIHADGGTVDMRAQARAGFADTVLNMDGIVQARTLGTRNGQVVIDGGSAGITAVGGTIDVSGRGAGQTGGSASVLGDKVGLVSTASIDASGDAGGGIIHVGGDFHGAGPDRNALYTLVLPGATLRADAITSGNGGQVSVWSDAHTTFGGAISAGGGALSGDGGYAEVSGHDLLDMQGSVALTAPHGSAGTLLLDPYNLVIASNATTPNLNGTLAPSGGDLATSTLAYADPAGQPASAVNGTSTITAGAVGALMQGANVILQATNNVDVQATIAAAAGNQQGSLTIQAGNNITVENGVNITTNRTDLVLAAGNTLGGTSGTTGPIGLLSIGANDILSTSGTTGTSTRGGSGSGTISLGGLQVGFGAGAQLNAFDGVSVTSSGAGNSVTLPKVSATGAITVSSAGSIGQTTDGLTAGANSTFTITNGTRDIVLYGLNGTAAVNNFNGSAVNFAVGAGAGLGTVAFADGSASYILPSFGATPNAIALYNVVASAGATLPAYGTNGLGGGNNALGDPNVLTVTARSIQQSAAISVPGPSKFAAVNAITLGATSGPRTFTPGGLVTFSGTAVSIVSTAGLLSAGTATNGLNEFAAGDITEGASGLTLSGATSTFTILGARHNVVLYNNGLGGTLNNNTFGGQPVQFAVQSGGALGTVALAENSTSTVYSPPTFNGSASPQALAVYDTQATVTLPAVTLANGLVGNNAIGTPDALTLTGQNVQNTGPLVVPGSTSVTASGGTITLGANASTFNPTGNVAFNATTVNLTTTGPLSSSGTATTLSETAGGAITQGGPLSVTGATALDAGGNPITLNNPLNSFGGNVSFHGAAVTLGATGNLSTSGAATGTLSETATGRISEGAGGIQVSGGGAVGFTSGLNQDIVLLDAGNNFGGSAVTLTNSGATGNVGFRDVNGTDPLTLANTTLGTLVLDVKGATSLPSGLTLSGVVGSNAAGGTTALDVTTHGGDITQGGAVSVTGTSNLNAGANNVTLATATNLFVGNVGFSGANVTLATNGALSASGTATGNLQETAGAGTLVQTGGALTVTGTTTLSNAGRDITLNNSSNSFGGTVSFTGAAVTLVANGALKSAGTATGVLSETAASISEGGAITLGSLTGNTFAVSGAAGNVTLDNAGNAFGGHALTIGTSGAGTLGAVTVTDNEATFAPLTLGAAAQSLALNDNAGGITIPGVTLNGAGTALSVNANGAVGQGGTLHVTQGGTSIVTAPAAAIVLGDTANTFGGNVAFTGAAVTVKASGNLSTSGSAAGVLTEVATGTISEGAGGLVVSAGSASFQTGTGQEVTLTDAGNNFNGLAVGISASSGALGAVAVTDNHATFPTVTLASPATSLALSDSAGGIVVQGATLTGTGTALTVSAAGNISQNGALLLTGVGGGASLDATVGGATGSINLSQATNQFGGNLAFKGNGVTLAATGDLSASGTDTGALSETATGSIHEGAAGIQLSGAASTATFTFNSGTANHDLGLGNANNNFNADTFTVTLNAGALNNVALGDLNAAPATLALPATLNSLVINYPNAPFVIPGNRFTGTGIGAGVGTNAAGTTDTLSVTAGGTITEGAGALDVTGTTHLDAGAHDINVANSGNLLRGNVDFHGVNVTLVDSLALSASGTAAGNLALTSGGSITEAGGITLTGNPLSNTAKFTVTGLGSDVTLSAANTLGGIPVTIAAGVGGSINKVSVTDNEATFTSLTLPNSLLSLALADTAGNINIPTVSIVGISPSALSVTASGNITQTGNVITNTFGGTALTTTGAASDIRLDTAGNTFGGNVVLNAARDATLVATGALSASGTVARNLSETASGLIGQTGGVLKVTGTTTLSDAGNTINLNNPGNSFGGVVSFTGGAVTLEGAGPLVSQGTASGGLLEVSSGSIGEGAAGIQLTAGGGSFTAGAGSTVDLSNAGNAFHGSPVTIAGAGGAALGAVTVVDNEFLSPFVPLTLSSPVSSLTLSNNVGGVVIPAAVVAGSGTDLTATAAGAITQSGAISNAGATALSAGANSIFLATAGNSFAGNVAFTGGAVTINSSGSALSTSGTATGGLAETAGGNITEGGALTVSGGAASFTVNSAANSVTLDNSGNNFGGNVVTAAGSTAAGLASATVVDSALAVLNLNLPSPVAGNVVATSLHSGVNLGSTGATARVTINGTTGNDLTVSAAGAITQSAAISTASSVSLVAAGNPITLGNINNSFGGNVAFNGGAVNLAASTALTSSGTASNGLVETSASSIAEGASGIQLTGGTGSFSAGAGATVDLSNANNAFHGKAVTITGAAPLGAVTVTDNESTFVPLTMGAAASTLTLNNSTGGVAVPGVQLTGVGTDLTVNSAGTVTQSGIISDAGAAALNAAGHDIILNNPSNSLSGNVAFTGATVTLATAGNLSTSGTASGSLGEVAGGTISEGAAGIQLSGVPGTNTASFVADGLGGAQDVLLNNAANNFGGEHLTVGTQGTGAVRNIALTDTAASTVVSVLPATANSLVASTAGGLSLPAGALSGALPNANGGADALSVAAGGNVSQTGALGVGGTTTVNAGTHDIALDTAGNAFTGNVAFVGHTVALASNGALSTSGSASGSLTESAGGTLSEGAAGLQMGGAAGSGSATFRVTSGTQNVLLTNAGNNFNGDAITVAASGGSVGNVGITDTSANFGALTMPATAASLVVSDANSAVVLPATTLSGPVGGLNAAGGTGTLVITAGGNITQSGTQAIAGTSQLNAGAHAIALNDLNNSFGGNVAFTGTNVDLAATGAMTTSGTASGNLSEHSTGPLGQGGVLTVAGSSTFIADAVPQAITLNNAANQLSGPVSVTGSTVVLVNNGALQLQGSASSSLSVQAAGPITESGALTVGGPAQFTALSGTMPQDISLTNGSNSFAAPVSFSGANVSITNSGALATAGTATGTLTETAGGALTQSGALVVGAGGSLQAGSNDITLTDAGNQWTGNLAFNGANVALAAASALSSSGHASGNLSETSAAGIAQGGALTVGGTTTLQSGGAAINLGNPGNQFTGPVNFTGGNVTLADTGNLASSGTAAGTLTENATGAISQSGAISAGTLALTAGGAFTQGNLINDANGGSVTATQINLQGNLNVNGGTLTLNATGPGPAVAQPDTRLFNTTQPLLPDGELLLLSGSAVNQTAGTIHVATSGQLSVVASGGGSISLMQVGNDFTGGLSALAVPAGQPAVFNTAWSGRNPQQLIELTGGNVNITGSGIEGDIVHITADHLATQGTAKIVARLPFSSQQGSLHSEPDLVLTLGPAALAGGFSFGTGTAPLNIVAGSTSTGGRTLGPNAGYITIRPKGGGQGNAIFIAGPTLNVAGYQFFYDGSGKLSEVPVFYNGQLPKTPQLTGALASVAAIAEQSRRDRFEETVRTENVAIRLRAGVISEVGPGRPATTGTEGAAPPPGCASSGAGLGCNAE